MSETNHLWTDFDLQMTRGDEGQLALTVTKTQDGTESAQDISTGLLRVIGKLSLSDADSAAVFNLTSAEGGGIEIVSASGGTAIATIPPAATADLPSRLTPVYVRCTWTDADDNPHTFQKGKLTVYSN